MVSLGNICMQVKGGVLDRTNILVPPERLNIGTTMESRTKQMMQTYFQMSIATLGLHKVRGHIPCLHSHRLFSVLGIANSKLLNLRTNSLLQ